MLTRRRVESTKERISREETLYNNCHETKNIIVANGFVSFTAHFKHLGSIVSFNLRDDVGIDKRISIASKSMGALHSFWINSEVELFSKYLTFLAIPINLLLWGCENWALRKNLLDKLEVFLHRNIRRILQINMRQVKDERITNASIRKSFFNIPKI